jgi:hypothetical protein
MDNGRLSQSPLERVAGVRPYSDQKWQAIENRLIKQAKERGGWLWLRLLSQRDIRARLSVVILS